MNFIQQKPKSDGIWLYDETLYQDTAFSYPQIDYDYPRKSSMDSLEGALRPGGALRLMSREAIGILGQYIAVGTIDGLLPSLAYPIFQQYLNFNGYEAASYSTLVTISWSLKIFLGILTDCFPMFGLKRKPYILIGWLVCIVALCCMASRPFPKPYMSSELIKAIGYDRAKDVRGANDTYLHSILSSDEIGMLNTLAKNDSLYYILLSTLCSLGYMLADVASDAMVVQYAQREPLEVRGRLQSAIYGTRFAASLIPSIITGFCLNGVEYGGTFSWSLNPNVMYGIMLLPCLFAIMCTIFCLVEERELKPVFRNYVATLWKLLQLRVTWQICAFRFLSNLCYDFDATVSMIIPVQWVAVQPLPNAWFSVLNTVLLSGCIFACGRWGLNMNWRNAIAAATVLVVIIDATVIFCVTWDVNRDQYFFLGATTPDALPQAVRFVISAYCAVEIADIGNEGAVLSLITTIVNLADPFSTVIYKYIDSFFDVNQDDLAIDSTHVRWQVTYVYIIAFGMQLVSLVFLPLLPPQKAAVQWLKKRGGSNPCAAVVIVTVYFLTLTFSISTSIMSLYPSTSCWRIAGGDGHRVVDAKNNTICG
ncbi:transmembrane protein [Thraustotheca clavata]|uniref:Transmembrane protein n=1 Tax=Thraustotheca clavata TaxID=74557 RepID=A0A1W0A0I6_9STRA|nr:transmembrane protein [Thraustotheca clavata]